MRVRRRELGQKSGAERPSRNIADWRAIDRKTRVKSDLSDESDLSDGAGGLEKSNG